MLKIKHIHQHFLAITFFAVGIIGCSSTDDENEELKVAELTEITEKFQPKVKWAASVGSGVGDYFSRIKPAVAYGKVYSASREGDVYAFDENTGKRSWHIDLSAIDNEGFFSSNKSALISGGPITGQKKVYLGSENGQVFALASSNGELTWQSSVKGEVIAAPALDSGKLVVNTSSGVIKAFNASTGEDDWQIEQHVPPLTLRGISAPVIAGGGVIVGTADGALTVYLLEKGQQGWVAGIGEATGSTELDRVVDVDASPLVYGDSVYTISSRGNLSSVAIRTGRILWQRQYSSYRQISISGNTIFLTDIKGHVYAVDRNNGLELWSQLSLTNRNVTGPAVMGDYIVVGDFEGYLHWIDILTGDIVARIQLDSSAIYTTPTVVKDVLYSQSRSGELKAITIN